MSTIEKIVELIKERGLQQKEFARDLGLPENIVSEWKNGRLKPSIEHIAKIADYFGVTTDYLLKNEEENKNNLKREEKNMTKQDLEKLIANGTVDKNLHEEFFNDDEIDDMCEESYLVEYDNRKKYHQILHTREFYFKLKNENKFKLVGLDIETSNKNEQNQPIKTESIRENIIFILNCFGSISISDVSKEYKNEFAKELDYLCKEELVVKLKLTGDKESYILRNKWEEIIKGFDTETSNEPIPEFKEA